MEETLRKAAQDSGLSILQLSKRGNLPYMSLHSFMRGTRTLTLPTASRLAPADVALKYKELWMVEAVFRSLKSVLETRPIYHKCDDTIRGHVFCSFLALVLLKELQARLEAHGWRPEWERLKADLDALSEITVVNAGKSFVIRSQTRGDAGKALQAVGVALGPTIRLAE